MPATVTFSAMAMPPVMPVKVWRSDSTSKAPSPAIGISIRMKPTAVPSSASRSRDSAANSPSFSRARSWSASNRSSTVWSSWPLSRFLALAIRLAMWLVTTPGSSSWPLPA